MKTSEATKDENAVTGVGKQGNDDARLNEVKDPGLSGESSDKADRSMSWDMTKTQGSWDMTKTRSWSYRRSKRPKP
jgi:hypothetical protein